MASSIAYGAKCKSALSAKKGYTDLVLVFNGVDMANSSEGEGYEFVFTLAEQTANSIPFDASEDHLSAKTTSISFDGEALPP